ncbi:putative beta-lysine N-acetyltransferase [Carboxylicivirga sp. A043]|uniref:putative beta-lysine N-acetyltransferase n=1 Tax=Carboxylicivirga litoralis TaxID=2816963 RepID=UPI0021CB1FBA|nr:putative beta-lysine N-acetyltransferase [Carboxylicivirga sp. A043]MCU4156114.1 putative beta-lysine N-acetyltransferase [Carboxylicivirga sp. A043]
MNVYKEETIVSDVVESIGNGSLIQHGKHNDRVYLMKLNKRDATTMPVELTKMARAEGYTKIFCKVPKWAAPLFYANGFILEAAIPQFYNDEEDVFFISKFLSSDRLLNIEKDKLNGLGQLLYQQKEAKTLTSSSYNIRPLGIHDINQIAHIYDEIFETYPFPIHDPAFLKESMENDIHYFGAEKNGKIVAVAAAEVDRKGGNAEMTDFATLKAHQGNRLATYILQTMETEMLKQNITSLYTIARLNSLPMNKTFLRANYQYAGTLIKNTNIAGSIESMNILYKHL